MRDGSRQHLPFGVVSVPMHLWQKLGQRQADTHATKTSTRVQHTHATDVYKYVYIYIERERERDMHIYIYECALEHSMHRVKWSTEK